MLFGLTKQQHCARFSIPFPISHSRHIVGISAIRIDNGWNPLGDRFDKFLYFHGKKKIFLISEYLHRIFNQEFRISSLVVYTSPGIVIWDFPRDAKRARCVIVTEHPVEFDENSLQSCIDVIEITIFLPTSLVDDSFPTRRIRFPSTAAQR